MSASQNRGEWSELYAFIRLLKDGRIYAADENVNRLDDIYFPILKIIRSDEERRDIDYTTGETIRIFRDGLLLGEVSKDKLKETAGILFNRIFEGTSEKCGAFEIPELDAFLEEMKITQVKAASTEKVDIRMQVHDINTGYNPEVGFSIKSDVGSAPTLLNAAKNTRFRYAIHGINDEDMASINAIDKTNTKDYMKARMDELFRRSARVQYHSMLSDTYEGNLMLIDSMMPEIYAYLILYHYMTIAQRIYDCETLCQMLEIINPLGYKKRGIYTYKFKKLLCASALGMTPGKDWDGIEAATGGYIIVKRDGDVLCYHIYNRDFFEAYLLKNAAFDRPSATRHDYGYVYKDGDSYFIDLNIQVRFKKIQPSGRQRSIHEEVLLEKLVEIIGEMTGLE